MKETAEMLRARILNGAIALFIDKGIEKVTTRELTEHLGISRSHIYHYFPDWQTLCLAALTDFMQTDLDTLTSEISGLTPTKQLNALMLNYLPAAQDAVWQLYGALWQLAAHSAVWAGLAQSMVEKWQRLLADIISAGIATGEFNSSDSGRVTRQLGGMLNGYADLLVIAPTPAARQQAVDDIDAFIRLALLNTGHLRG